MIRALQHVFLFLAVCACSQEQSEQDSNASCSEGDGAAHLQVNGHMTEEGSKKMSPWCFSKPCRTIKGLCVHSGKCCDRAKFCKVPKNTGNWPLSTSWNPLAGNQQFAEAQLGVQIPDTTRFWTKNDWLSLVGHTSKVTAYKKVSSSPLTDKMEQITTQAIPLGLFNLHGDLSIWEALPPLISSQLCGLVSYDVGGYISSNVRVERVTIPTVQQDIYVQATISSKGSGTYEVTIVDGLGGEGVATIADEDICTGKNCPPVWNPDAGDQQTAETQLGVTISSNKKLWSKNSWTSLTGKVSQVIKFEQVAQSVLSDKLNQMSALSIPLGLFNLHGVNTIWEELPQLPIPGVGCDPVTYVVGGYLSKDERVELVTLPTVPQGPIYVSTKISSLDDGTFTVTLTDAMGGVSVATISDTTP